MGCFYLNKAVPRVSPYSHVQHANGKPAFRNFLIPWYSPNQEYRRFDPLVWVCLDRTLHIRPHQCFQAGRQPVQTPSRHSSDNVKREFSECAANRCQAQILICRHSVIPVNIQMAASIRCQSNRISRHRKLMW